MSLLRKTDVQFDRRTDPLWWGLAGVLGLVSLWVPRLLQSEDHSTQVVLAECALFFSGALIGSLRPQRVWRWAIAGLVAIVLQDIVLKDVSADWLASAAGASYLTETLPLYLAYTAPVLGGAYVGSYLTRGPLR